MCQLYAAAGQPRQLDSGELRERIAPRDQAPTEPALPPTGRSTSPPGIDQFAAVLELRKPPGTLRHRRSDRQPDVVGVLTGDHSSGAGRLEQG